MRRLERRDVPLRPPAEGVARVAWAAVFELNLPNVLTMLRILLVPVLVVVLLDESANGDLLAAIVFALASVTDAMDGYLARSRDAITTFGKLMDPIADKLLIIAALVALVSLDRLAAWVAMVIIARELTVTVTRMQATQQGVDHRGELVGQGEDDRAGRGDLLPHRRRRPVAGLGRRPRLRRGRDHDRQRRGLLLRPAARAARGRGAARGRRRGSPSRRGPERAGRQRPATSSHSRIDVWCAACSPVASSWRSSPSRPKRSQTTLCWWIVSRFSWRALTKCSSERSVSCVDDAADHLAHAVLDEARAAVGLLDDGAPRRCAS